MTFKVKVLTCCEPNFWYKDYLGQVFTVVEDEGDIQLWRVLNPPKKAVRYVQERENGWKGDLFLQKRDCEDEFFILMRSVVDG